MLMLNPYYLLIVLTIGEFPVSGGWDSCLLAQQMMHPVPTLCQAVRNGERHGPPMPLPDVLKPR